MKIYKQESPLIVKVVIRKQGEKASYVPLCDTTVEEVKSLIVSLIKTANISPLIEGKRTSVDIRETRGRKKLAATSLSFYGLSPAETRKLIIKHFEDHK